MSKSETSSKIMKRSRGDEMAISSANSQLAAGPLAKAMRTAPQLGTNGGSNRWPFTVARDYLDSKRSGRGPIQSTNFDIGEPVTDTPGYISNYWIPYAKLARSFREEFTDITQLYQIIFTKKDPRPITVRRNRIPKEASRRYTMFNIAQWNYMQQRKEKMPSSREEVLKPYDIWKEWTMEGIAAQEEGFEEASGNFEKGKEYLLNIRIRGLAFTYNIWGDDIAPGTTLWIILKKRECPRKGEYIIRPFGKDVENISGVGEKRTDRPYQLIPYANSNHITPPDCELEFRDEFGYEHRGLALYVGTLHKPGHAGCKPNLVDVPYSVDAIVAQGQIFIHFDPAIPEVVE